MGKSFYLGFGLVFLNSATVAAVEEAEGADY